MLMMCSGGRYRISSILFNMPYHPVDSVRSVKRRMLKQSWKSNSRMAVKCGYADIVNISTPGRNNI